jgi:hypothetical protein
MHSKLLATFACATYQELGVPLQVLDQAAKGARHNRQVPQAHIHWIPANTVPLSCQDAVMECIIAVCVFRFFNAQSPA